MTFLADRIPSGDEKAVASEYAISFGGNAVTVAFCCAKLSDLTDILDQRDRDYCIAALLAR